MPSRSSDAHGDFYRRVGFALAWTSTNTGPNAKACRESGSGSWKQARPLSPEPGAAAGFFTKKLATRNPVVPAVVNGLVLFDFDAAPVEELVTKYDLALPDGAWRVRTARGTHLYASAPSGLPGMKVELTPERVTVIADGYLLAPPSRHPSGLVYAFENVEVESEGDHPPRLDAALIERLRELADGGRQRVAELVDSGEPIDPGDRHAALMHHAARLRGEGLGAKAIRAALEELSERFVEPTGRSGELDGIVRWVMEKPAPPPLDPDEVDLLRALDELPGKPPRTARSEATKATKATKGGSQADFGRFSRFGHLGTWAMPELDPRALHGPAGAWATIASDYIEGARVGILAASLAAFGNAVGGGPYTQVGATRHAASEYVLLLGPTSTARKGDTVRIGTHPLEYADPDWRPRIQNGFGSGEGVVWEVRDEIVELECDGSDRTVDAGSSDKRLLIRQSEFASILKVAARDGSTLSELLREAWDGDTLANRTKGRKVVATNAHVSILAGCTPEELQRLVTATEIANGFLNRFLIVAVARERLRENPAPLPERLSEEHAQVFADALTFARKQSGRIERDPAAAETWKLVYATELAVDRPGLAGAALGRAEAHTLRLSLLYALLDRSGVIRDEHVHAALALWRYCEASTRMLFGEALGHPVADAIIAELERRAPKPISRTELRDLFARKRPLAEIEQALAQLEVLGRIRIERRDTGGRPAELIALEER